MSKLRKALNKKTNEVSTKSVKKYMNSMAPQGFRYDEEQKGIFVLKPNEKQDFTYNLKADLPKEIEGIKITPDNLFNALYVTQTTFDITDAIIEINGVKGKATELLVKNIRGSEEGRFYLYPPPFPEIKIPFVLGIGGEKVEFKIKQIPFGSLECHKFESYEPKYMSLLLTYTIKTKKLDINISRDLNKIKYLEDVVKLKNVLIGFDKGEFLLDGNNLELRPRKAEEVSNSIELLVSVYEKVVELQNFFTVKFENEFNFTNATAKLARKLYASFVMNRFFYADMNNDDIHYISFDEMTPEMKRGFNNGEGKFAFAAQQAYKNTFFGVEIEYIEMIIFNGVNIVEIDEQEKKVSFKVDEEGFIIKRYFKEIKDKGFYFSDYVPKDRDMILDLNELKW